MRHHGQPTPYEVYCHHCRVTFAPGTRRCVHCSGRLSQEAPLGTLQDGPSMPLHPVEELMEEPADFAVEDEKPKRIGFSPLTMVWVALLLVGYLYRACSG